MPITDLTNTAWASAATTRHPDDPQHHHQPGHPSCTQMRHSGRLSTAPPLPERSSWHPTFDQGYWRRCRGDRITASQWCVSHAEILTDGMSTFWGVGA